MDNTENLNPDHQPSERANEPFVTNARADVQMDVGGPTDPAVFKDSVIEREKISKVGPRGHSSVFAVFDTQNDLETAITLFKERGFRNSDVSVLLPDGSSAQNMAHEKSTKAPEGIAIGATSGVVVGGALGWLVGVGTIAIPGIGPFLAAGPIMAAIAGAGLVGTVGGLAGGLIGLGVPEYEAKRYEGFVREGAYLISVHVDDSEWQRRAESVLKANNARDIANSTEEKINSRPAV